MTDVTLGGPEIGPVAVEIRTGTLVVAGTNIGVLVPLQRPDAMFEGARIRYGAETIITVAC